MSSADSLSDDPGEPNNNNDGHPSTSDDSDTSPMKKLSNIDASNHVDFEKETLTAAEHSDTDEIDNNNDNSINSNMKSEDVIEDKFDSDSDEKIYYNKNIIENSVQNIKSTESDYISKDKINNENSYSESNEEGNLINEIKDDLQENMDSSMININKDESNRGVEDNISAEPTQIIEESINLRKPLGNSILADRLRKQAQDVKFKSPLKLTADIDDETDQQLLVVPSPKAKRRLYRDHLLEKHANIILKDLVEDMDAEMQDGDDYGYEEEEEEDMNEKDTKNDDNVSENKSDLNEIEKAVVDEIEKNADIETLTDEEIQRQIYEQIVQMRLSADLEEIKKIIRIITGQWRSGNLRKDPKDETLQRTFEGDANERKKLEQKRSERNQRKRIRLEQQVREINAQSIEQMVERAMWIRAAEEEDARDTDIIRGKIARTMSTDPKLEVLERLEEAAFIREIKQKQQNKKKWKSIYVKKTAPDSITKHRFEASVLDLNTSEANKSSFTFSHRAISKTDYNKPEKKTIKDHRNSVNKELQKFITQKQ